MGPAMTIRFTRGRNGKAPALTCIRDDGSVAWQRSSEYFVRHDLIHYAIETALGYRKAFLGLVAGGRDLDDFGTREHAKDTYTDEEIWAEHIAAAIQFPSAAGGPPASDAEVVAYVHKACVDRGQTPPAITTEQTAAIRRRIGELHDQWRRLPAGETLELIF